MNIFALHKSPDQAAQMMCDKHIAKMLLESCQMLSTARWRHDGGLDEDPVVWAIMNNYCIPAYKSHAATRWAGDSLDNYIWLSLHAAALNREYTFRFGGRRHDISVVTLPLLLTKPIGLSKRGLTPHPQCMPERYRGPDTIEAYRRYYHSKSFARWDRGRPAPYWWQRSPYVDSATSRASSH